VLSSSYSIDGIASNLSEFTHSIWKVLLVNFLRIRFSSKWYITHQNWDEVWFSCRGEGGGGNHKICVPCAAHACTNKLRYDKILFSATVATFSQLCEKRLSQRILVKLSCRTVKLRRRKGHRNFTKLSLKRVRGYECLYSRMPSAAFPYYQIGSAV